MPYKHQSNATSSVVAAPRPPSSYFDFEIDLDVGSHKNSFHIYYSNTPCSNRSASSSSPSVASVTNTTSTSAVFVLIHGGGHTALSWALVARQLSAHYNVLAFDLRGHGLTHTSNDTDLSSETLVKDIIEVVRTFYEVINKTSVPPIVLAGHSLGGALVVRVCATKELPVVGLCVVDVVEGSAIDSLKYMREIVKKRPTSFASPQLAVQWCMKNGVVRNAQSAAISIPSQLKEVTALVPSFSAALSPALTASTYVSTASAVSSSSSDEKDVISYSSPCASLSDASEDQMLPPPSRQKITQFVWITDLLASEKYWRGWFEGLSALFLSCNAVKLLVLAGPDRMDKELMFAHMAGKFQLTMFPQVGHCVQEDSPDKMATTLLQFADRYRFGQAARP